MSIVFIWRGFGLIVPIVFGICAWIVSYWFEDTRIGNASYMGWTSFYTAIVLLLPGLGMMFAKDEATGKRDKHDFMFIPVLFWSIGLGALCAYLLITADPEPDENTTNTEQTIQPKEEEEVVNYRTINFINSSVDSLELVISDASGEIDRFIVEPKSWATRDIEPSGYSFESLDLNGKSVAKVEVKHTGEPTKANDDYDAAWIQLDGGEHNLIMIDVTPMLPADFKSTDLKTVDWTAQVVKTYDPSSLMEPAYPKDAGNTVRMLEPGDLLPSKVEKNEEVYAIITVPSDKKLTNEYLQERLMQLYFE